MKTIFRLLLLLLLTGCAGLQPSGGEHSLSIQLDGSTDATAEVTIDRRPDGLLVTFDVTDDSLVSKPKEKIWMSDSVEFYADLRPYRERVLINGYAKGAFQIIAVPPVAGNPVRCEIVSRGFPVPEGFSADGRLTEQGYQIQLFLPEKSFTEVHGPFRDPLYLDVALKDVDADGTKALFWKGNGDNWQYPHNFAPVCLPMDEN
jgi:hypothetical protein